MRGEAEGERTSYGRREMERESSRSLPELPKERAEKNDSVAASSSRGLEKLRREAWGGRGAGAR